MAYPSYRCLNCKKSYQRIERIDHKCPICNSKLVRNRLEDKRIYNAKREIDNQELGE